MKPNLIDISTIQKDIKIYHFKKNSFIINIFISVILFIFLFCIFYIFRSPYNKKQKREITLNKLRYILNRTNLELSNRTYN